jgi:hypothetical protein
MVFGNVAGYVKYEGAGVANATVYAKLVGSTNDDESVFSATTANGQYGFTLDVTGGKQWVIKVFPFNVPGGTQLANKTLDAISAGNTSLDITLVTK